LSAEIELSIITLLNTNLDVTLDIFFVHYSWH